VPFSAEDGDSHQQGKLAKKDDHPAKTNFGEVPLAPRRSFSPAMQIFEQGVAGLTLMG
jgi:hypothetical protein